MAEQEQDPLDWLSGETKVNPGAVDTPDLDEEMRVRQKERDDAESTKWLFDGDLDSAGSNLSDLIVPPKETGWLDITGRVVRDIGQGMMEAPRRSALGGARDALQSMSNLADEFGDWMNANVLDLGGAQIFDKEGNFAPKIVGPGEVGPEETGLNLPEVTQPSTVTGGALRSISQFLTGYLLAGKALEGVKAGTTWAQLLKAAGQGAIADFTSFDGHQQRLSNVVQQFPALQNPVTEYLAADPNDSEMEGRLKNAIEGLGIGAVTDGLFQGIRYFRGLRQAHLQASPDAGAEKVLGEIGSDPKATLRAAQNMDLLGDDKSPLFQLGTGKLKSGEAQTVLPVPEDIAAKGLTKTQAGGEDVFINFGKINAPDDIKNVMGQMADAFSGSVDKARRGVRTNIQTIAGADQENAWRILIERRMGQTLNAEQSLAARQLWTASADKLKQVAEVAAMNPTPENLFQFRRMLAVTHAIQKEVIGARTETARALQQWSIPAGGNTQKFQNVMQALDRSGGEEVSQELAKRILAASQSDAPYATIARMAEKGAFARTVDAVHEYWINALLSGPKTHIVNAMSNTSVNALSITERAVAARIGQLTGDGGVEVGEAMAEIAGTRSAFKDAFINAAKAFKSGQTGFGMNKLEGARTRAISSTNFNIRSDSWLGQGIDMLGSAVNVPGRTLQASDEFFKTFAYRQALHSLAYRTAQQDIRAGRIANSADAIKSRMADIIANPPEGIAIDAAQEAAYRTFTSDPGPWTKKIMQVRSAVPGARWVMPFVNTPSNILKYTFERTPLAPLSASYRAAIAKGGAEASLARARMTLGTGMMMVAGDLAMDGLVTGSGPPPGPQRDNWMRQGNRPYSLKVGDKWVAYSRADPIGFLFGMAADIAEFNKNSDFDEDMDIGEVAAAVVFSAAENLKEKSYLQGFSLLVQALEDSDRFGESYFKKLGSSFVPALSGEVTRQLDPIQRETANILDAIKAKTPGWSQDLPARRDLYGRERSYESGFGTAYDTLSPLYGSTMKPEPIDQEMQKEGFFIGMPARGFTIDGQFVSLRNRPDIYSRFLELQGNTKPSQMGDVGEMLAERFGDHTLLETLNGIIADKEADFQDYSDTYYQLKEPDDKKDFLMKVVRFYRKAAQEHVMGEFPWLKDRANALRSKRNAGRETSDESMPVTVE